MLDFHIKICLLQIDFADTISKKFPGIYWKIYRRSMKPTKENFRNPQESLTKSPWVTTILTSTLLQFYMRFPSHITRAVHCCAPRSRARLYVTGSTRGVSSLALVSRLNQAENISSNSQDARGKQRCIFKSGIEPRGFTAEMLRAADLTDVVVSREKTLC